MYIAVGGQQKSSMHTVKNCVGSFMSNNVMRKAGEYALVWNPLLWIIRLCVEIAEE